MKQTIVPLLLSLALCAGCARKEDGIAVFGEGDLERFESEPAGAVQAVAVDGAAFGRALRVAPRDGGRLRVFAPVQAAVKTGDVLFLRFQMRSAGGGDARAEVRFEPGVSRWSAPLKMAARAGQEWTVYEYPFTVRRDYAPGEGRLEFHMGAGQPEIEIGGMELTNYADTKAIADLPCTRLDYAGSDPGAPWRQAAAERIEKIRKSELVVAVKDASGAPVANAAVSVRMNKHAFGFGSAVNVPLVTQPQPHIPAESVDRYKQEFVRLFNKAVFENATKWPQWEQPGGPDRVKEVAGWLRENGLSLRGHVLVWPSWRWLPERLKQLEGDPPALRKAVIDHIRDEASALKGLIAEWDVMNEPYSNHDLMDILGREVMAGWFEEARRAAPGARLYINDYGILTPGDPKHRDHYEETIAYLIEKGAPLDGIGMQGHFKSEVTPPEEAMAILDRFAKFGKEIQITEFDLDTVDQKLQADYTRDLLTIAFSHPAVKGFMLWGFWEGRHWIPNGAMFRRDWTAKPNAEAYQDLVFSEWWTNEKGRTDDQGEYVVRGFHGEYDVEVRREAEIRTVEVTLGKDGASVSVEM